MKGNLFVPACLFLANIASAYEITGTVTSKGEPLPGVVITRIGIIGGNNSDTAYAVTDMDGKYTVDSGTGNPVMLIASFVSHISEMKWVDGNVVNIELKETPYVPVKFFSSLLDQTAVLNFTMTQQLNSMGLSRDEFNVFLSDNALVFSIDTPKDAEPGTDIKNFGNITIKGYLNQLKAEGELDDFLSQMKSSGMKWVFGVYSKSKSKWVQYKEYDVDQIRKLL